jgi:TetR/AcrR family transcriptional regulator, mexJK operon transcriptional repressor
VNTSKEGLFEAVVRQKCSDVVLAIHVDASGSLEQQLTEIGHSFLAMVLSPPILEFHQLMVSIGRTFPEIGRLFYKTGPDSAYRLVASWIAKNQKDGRIVDEDPHRLAVLFLDMLIGEHQLGLLTSVQRAVRQDKIDETVRVAVKVFLRGGCASP